MKIFRQAVKWLKRINRTSIVIDEPFSNFSDSKKFNFEKMSTEFNYNESYNESKSSNNRSKKYNQNNSK